jgi:CBS domain-containing protein
MTRADTHLDATLRHLGAAYYESLHGRATRSDVARALDTVEEHLGEQGPPAPKAPRHEELRKRRWARRVSDVMTTTVVTVDRITPYQDIDRLLAKHRIGGVPVLKMGREVAGVVSETDLLAAEDETRRAARMVGSMGRRWHLRKQPHVRLTADALMTSPAITIGPDATIPGAARLMNTHHIGRLPVTDEKGKLIGIVGRRDLLSVFLRPDADIAHDARQVLAELPLADPKEVMAEVRHGVVTLTGTMRPEADHENDLMPLALRLIWDIDGVVDVVNRLGEAKVARSA